MSRDPLIRNKRTTRNEAYQPIRVTAKFFELDTELRVEHEEKLKRVVHRAIDKVQRLFSGK